MAVCAPYPAHDHDDQGFEEQAIGVHGGLATARRGSRKGDRIDQLDQGNQEGGIAYHETGSVGEVVLDHTEPPRWTTIWRGFDL